MIGRFALPAFALLAGCAASVDDVPQFVASTASIASFNIPVRSVGERRFDGVVRQQYDFSCGSAALATLLRYHYDFDVGEAVAFRGMWSKGDQAQIRRVGFSLLDMKRWLASRGLDADGYEVPLEDIAQAGVPGIALISVRDYRHFVVVKGVRGDEVLLGDPSVGLTVMTRANFQAAWNGVYFILAQEQELAKSRFNQASQWAGYARAPIGSGFADPISQQALALTNPVRGDF